VVVAGTNFRYKQLQRVTAESILAFHEDVKRHQDGAMGYDRNFNITVKCRKTIDELFKEHRKDLGPDYKEWRAWDNERFFQALYLCAQIRSDGSELA
jgi:hypothetical protein